MKIIAGALVVAATVLGQIVAYQIVAQVVPAYMPVWAIAVVFTWMGLLLSAVSD